MEASYFSLMSAVGIVILGFSVILIMVSFSPVVSIGYYVFHT